MTGSANLATLPPAGALDTLSGARSSACKVSTRYLPSDLEQTWMKHAAAWGADFCNHMTEVENSTRVWLDTLAQHTQLQGKQTEGQSPAEVRAAKGPQPSISMSYCACISCAVLHCKLKQPCTATGRACSSK